MIWFARGILALIALGWLATLGKVIARKLRPEWTLTPEDPEADPATSISIVIPARDEVDNIGACLEAALAQDHPNLQVVVLDDNSSDGTGAIVRDLAARDDRLTALEGDGAPLPGGWFGKPWAVQRAQQAATGDWLIFVDADVRLAPEAASRVVRYAIDNDLAMVTGFGALIMESFWERVLQPAVGGMILAGNDLGRVNDPERIDDNIANGQFIAVSRAAYDAVGGHEAVRQDILDDVGLARALIRGGYRYHCLFMRTLYRCRMYTSLGEIWEGWGKNLFAGMRYSWGNAIAAILATYAFSLLGPTLLLLGAAGVVGEEWLWWGVGLTALMQIVRLVMDWIWEHRLAYGLTHALGNAMLIALILYSGARTSRGEVTWKGRTYRPTNQE